MATIVPWDRGPEQAGEHFIARFEEKGDWLRGAIRCGVNGNVVATVPVPIFRGRHPAGPSQKGTGTVA